MSNQQPHEAMPSDVGRPRGAGRATTEMLRFNVGREGDVVPVLDKRIPGRGLWLSAERHVINTVWAKNLFIKAVRRNVAVPDDSTGRIDDLIVGRCLGLTRLARSADEA